MGLSTTVLAKMIESLEKALRVLDRKHADATTPLDELETVRAGVIHNFKFTYDICWKLIKRWLEENISPDCADGVARRELYRLAAENLLIEDVACWMEFHRARNLTSHTYDGDTANDVEKVALAFLPHAKKLLNRLQAGGS